MCLGQKGTCFAAACLGHFTLARVLLGLEAVMAPSLTGWVTLSLRVLINGDHNPTPKGESEGYRMSWSLTHMGSPTSTGTLPTPLEAPTERRSRKYPPRTTQRAKGPSRNRAPLLTCSSAGLRPGVLTGAWGTPAQRPWFSGRGRRGRPEHSAWRLDMSV